MHYSHYLRNSGHKGRQSDGTMTDCRNSSTLLVSLCYLKDILVVGSAGQIDMIISHWE